MIGRAGRRLKAYEDSVGIWTIGIGHTSAAGAPLVTAGLTITSAQCDAIFERDEQAYVAAVRKVLNVAVSQNAFDALVSICYNIGPGAFAGSTFLKRINAGDTAGAYDAILMWKKPAAIITRRQAEAQQFVTAYAVAMPRATTIAKPIAVAGFVIEVMHTDVPTPVIVPVAPAVTAQPNLLMWFLRWIIHTYGDNVRVWRGPPCVMVRWGCGHRSNPRTLSRTRGSIELVRAEQRRRWTRSEKERLLAVSFEPGVSASEVARAAGIHVSQLFRWRKLFWERVVSPVPVPALVPVAVVPPPRPTSVEAEPQLTRPRRSVGHIEISLGGGRRVRVGSDVDAAALRRVLDALEGRLSRCRPTCGSGWPPATPTCARAFPAWG
nr:glycoside hydrolase family protein [Methylobacterium goesingense]